MSSLEGLLGNERRVRLGICALLCVAAAAYLLPFVDRGWIAHDEGMLGQMAERVLSGEIPHRDFDDPYTGGLTYLHALGFKIFGVRLLSLRWLLLAATLVWVPVVYFLATRFVPPVVAALVTAVAVTWSLPNYFASMPSYYNLFLATFGTAALFKHIERGGRGWLVLAGVCGGVSFLVKSVGALFLVAGALFLLFRAQSPDEAEAPADQTPSTGFLLLESACCITLIAALVSLVGERRTPMNVLHFVTPLAAVVGVLLWTEWHEGRGALRGRVQCAWRLLWPFAVGAAAPVIIFLLPYITTGTTGSFYDGVFLALERRLGQAERSFPPAENVAWALPYGAALFAIALGWRTRWGAHAALVAGLAVAAALATLDRDGSYLALWNSARFLPVFAILAGCLMIGRPLTLSAGRRQQLFLLVAVLAAIGLVQFPFSAPIYFCYTAPLLVLALLPVASLGARPLHLTLLAGYLVFAVISLNVGYVWNIGVVHQPDYEVAAVGRLPRARIRMPSADGSEYLALFNEVRTRVAPGGYVLATPDCPEVYFLLGLRNPTRDMYEFLRGSRRTNEETLALIERHGINLVVINREPHFSGPIDPALETALESRFPRSAVVGRFMVRWRA